MPISSDLNKVYVYGELSSDDSIRLLAALHNIVSKKMYTDFLLDFSDCKKAFSPQMLALAATCQSYWKQGIDVELKMPNDPKLARLFKNTNWANLIDFRTYEESKFRGYTHVPALRFSNGKEQYLFVNKVLDVLLSAIRHLSRDDLRAIEWSINEITDNVINHAESNVGGFIQVTNFIQREQIEFTVCDCGLGIPSTLRAGHPELNSDQEALDRAIREGITRDSDIGQGNGLYGNWRITRKSLGSSQIFSNYATLRSDTDTVRVEPSDIPFPGTLVTARIGYSEKLDLSDALVFSGKKFIPSDYIDSHFEQDEAGNITFSLLDESDGFGSRSAGDPVRRKLRNVAACIEDGRAIVDFSGVKLVSSSFADEVFGKLFVEMGPIEFTRRIEFRKVDPLVRDLIDKAIMQRMKQL
jgi:hypothetical protein